MRAHHDAGLTVVFMASKTVSVEEIMARAVARRDELNIFIKILYNYLNNMDLNHEYGDDTKRADCMDGLTVGPNHQGSSLRMERP